VIRGRGAPGKVASSHAPLRIPALGLLVPNLAMGPLPEEFKALATDLESLDGSVRSRGDLGFDSVPPVGGLLT
jgi:hypothetical protein